MDDEEGVYAGGAVVVEERGVDVFVEDMSGGWWVCRGEFDWFVGSRWYLVERCALRDLVAEIWLGG